MAKVRAWRTIGCNPCEDPPVTISIGQVGSGGCFPWLMSLEFAREVFGPVVEQITEKPQLINLSMSFVDEGI